MLLAASIGAAPAWADPAAAKVHYQKGRSYFQLGDYRKALEEFRSAHVEKADPAFLFNIAECHRLLAEPTEAAVFYKKVIALTPPSNVLHDDARRRVAELEAATLPPPSGVAPPPPARARDAPTSLVPTAAAETPPPGALQITAPDSPPAATPRPIYTRGWFWVAVGAVVVGAAGAWALSSKEGGPEVPMTALHNQGIFAQ